jgi:murein DD-endopeptidase MepM/ murein hydrolase activator NlpD
MRKPASALIALFLCLTMAACEAAAPGGSTSKPILTARPSPYPAVQTALATLPLGSPSPAPPTVTPAELSPVVTPQPPVLTATPVVELCSPLIEHPLVELPEIVSAPYNPPPMGSDARHQGVDFSYYRRGKRTSILGVGVQSVFAGQVAASISDSFPYGNVVIIETPVSDLPSALAEQFGMQADQSLYTLYAHMGAAPLVNSGDAVKTCQLLGEVGKSGNAGVPHLHLEMRIGPAGRQFASMAFYSTQTTQEERDNYVLWRMSGEFQHFDPMSLLAP